nr:unnamed protein product [Haemonchus contortus]
MDACVGRTRKKNWIANLGATVICAKKHEWLRRRVYFFRQTFFGGSVVRRSEQGSEVDTLTGPSNGLAAKNPGRRPDRSAICSRPSFHERSDRGSRMGHVVHMEPLPINCRNNLMPSDAISPRRPANNKEAIRETIAQNQV